LDREGATGDFNDWAAIEVIGEEVGINGSRHENDTQVGVCVDHVTEDYHDEVRVDIAFVNFVNDDMRHPTEAVLQLPEQHTCQTSQKVSKVEGTSSAKRTSDDEIFERCQITRLCQI